MREMMLHRVISKKLGVLILAALFMGSFGLSSVFALDMPIGVKPAQKKNKFLPRIRAAVTVGGDYSDNVNTAPGRNSHGVRLRVSPEFNIEMPDLTLLSQYFGNNRFYINGGYKYGYMGIDGTEVDFHRNAHLAYAGMRYSVSPKATLGGNYIYQRDQYPFLNSGDTYTLNDVLTQFEFEPFARLSVEPYYHFQNFNDASFEASPAFDSFNDYGDNRVGTSGLYKLTSKLSALGNFEYQNRSFRDTDLKDFQAVDFRAGLGLQMTRKVYIAALGGYEQRFFEVGKDEGSMLWDLRLNYLPTRRLNVAMFYTYDLVDTITTEFLTETSTGKPGSPGLIDFIPRQYRAIRVQRQGANLGYTITDKDRIETSFVYQFARSSSGDDELPASFSPSDKLNENDYQFSVNYAHAFAAWLNLTLGYTNLGRNTNISDNFRANLFSFGMRIGW